MPAGPALLFIGAIYDESSDLLPFFGRDEEGVGEGDVDLDPL
jgi:hypothetical protein